MAYRKIKLDGTLAKPTKSNKIEAQAFTAQVKDYLASCVSDSGELVKAPKKTKRIRFIDNPNFYVKSPARLHRSPVSEAGHLHSHRRSG